MMHQSMGCAMALRTAVGVEFEVARRGLRKLRETDCASGSNCAGVGQRTTAFGETRLRQEVQ